MNRIKKRIGLYLLRKIRQIFFDVDYVNGFRLTRGLGSVLYLKQRCESLKKSLRESDRRLVEALDELWCWRCGW